MTEARIDPDSVSRGWTPKPLDPLRYHKRSIKPFEALSLILAQVPEGSRVLDVGCGDGSFSLMIRELKHALVLGLEPHAARLEEARRRGLQARHGMFCDETVRDMGLFDVIIFADVLEHMATPYDALRLARSMLAPQGSVVASMPNVAHWSVRLGLLGGSFAYADEGIMDATHLRWFTRHSMKLLFTSAGFCVKSVRGTAGLWMKEYRTIWPWCLIGKRLTRAVVISMLDRVPTLFACQFVVRAEAS